MNWNVYIVRTACDKLYTGISTDVERRFAEHLRMFETKKGPGAKFFRGHKPLSVVLIESYESRSKASVREAALKKLSATKKVQLISEKSS